MVAGRTNERTTGHWDSKLNNRLKKLLFCKRKTNICFIREIRASIVVGGLVVGNEIEFIGRESLFRSKQSVDLIVRKTISSMKDFVFVICRL